MAKAKKCCPWCGGPEKRGRVLWPVKTVKIGVPGKTVSLSTEQAMEQLLKDMAEPTPASVTAGKAGKPSLFKIPCRIVQETPASILVEVLERLQDPDGDDAFFSEYRRIPRKLIHWITDEFVVIEAWFAKKDMGYDDAGLMISVDDLPPLEKRNVKRG